MIDTPRLTTETHDDRVEDRARTVEDCLAAARGVVREGRELRDAFDHYRALRGQIPKDHYNWLASQAIFAGRLQKMLAPLGVSCNDIALIAEALNGGDTLAKELDDAGLDAR